MHVHRYLHLLAEALQHRHEAFDGEAVEFRPPHPRKVTMSDAGQILGFARAQPALVQHLQHLASEDRLQLARFWMRPAKITKDVSAAVHQLHIVIARHSRSFSRLGLS